MSNTGSRVNITALTILRTPLGWAFLSSFPWFKSRPSVYSQFWAFPRDTLTVTLWPVHPSTPTFASSQWDSPSPAGWYARRSEVGMHRDLHTLSEDFTLTFQELSEARVRAGSRSWRITIFCLRISSLCRAS